MKRGQAEAKALRAVQALQLRLVGASYRHIGRTLAVSVRTAYYDVHDALATVDTVKRTQAERLLEIELERLDHLTMALRRGVAAGDPRAVLAAVRVMERRAKLLGLDAATKTTIGGTTDAPVTFTLHLGDGNTQRREP
jgi:hypothetical protein